MKNLSSVSDAKDIVTKEHLEDYAIAKTADSNLVHKTGAETVAGAKSFTDAMQVSRTTSGPILKLSSSASDTNFILERTNGAQCVLEAGSSVGLFGTKTNHGLQVRTNYTNRMAFDTSGGVTLATAPAANSNSNQLATTKWVNDKGYLTTETEPAFTNSPAAGITAQDISDWNGKSDFSGSYNDLTDKPDVPKVKILTYGQTYTAEEVASAVSNSGLLYVFYPHSGYADEGIYGCIDQHSATSYQFARLYHGAENVYYFTFTPPSTWGTMKHLQYADIYEVQGVYEYLDGSNGSYIDDYGLVSSGDLGDLATINKPSSDQTTKYLRGDGTWRPVVAETATKAYSIPFGNVTSNSATVFTATVPGVTSLYDGLICYIRNNNNQTSASGWTLNVNELGAKPVYNTMADATAVTTTFNKAYTMMFIYNSSRVSGGCWDMYYGYYANTTMAYGHLDYYFRARAGQAIYRYKYVMQGEDNRLYPITTTNQGSATQVAKIPTTVGLRPGHIWYYSNTTTISAGSVIGAQTLQAAGYATTATYNFNTSISAYHMVYLRGTYDKDKDLFYLYNDGSSPCTSYYTQVPSDTANITLSDYFVEGYYYILLGGSYSTANYLSNFADNPLYYFDGTNLIPASTKVANDIRTSIMGEDPAPNYTISGVGNTPVAIPDGLVIPEEMSDDFYGICRFSFAVYDDYDDINYQFKTDAFLWDVLIDPEVGHLMVFGYMWHGIKSLEINFLISDTTITSQGIYIDGEPFEVNPGYEWSITFGESFVDIPNISGQNTTKVLLPFNLHIPDQMDGGFTAYLNIRGNGVVYDSDPDDPFEVYNLPLYSLDGGLNFGSYTEDPDIIKEFEQQGLDLPMIPDMGFTIDENGYIQFSGGTTPTFHEVARDSVYWSIEFADIRPEIRDGVVYSVNGKNGNVIIDAGSVGAVLKSGDTLTGDIIFSSGGTNSPSIEMHDKEGDYDDHVGWRILNNTGVFNLDYQDNTTVDEMGDPSWANCLTIDRKHGINAVVYGSPNRNLLDNSWFTVNQKVGVTQFIGTTGNETTVDRWQLYGTSSQAKINDDCTIEVLTQYAPDQNNTNGFYQKLSQEISKRLLGKTITFSIMNYSGSSIYSVTADMPTTVAYKNSYQIANKTVSIYGPQGLTTMGLYLYVYKTNGYNSGNYMLIAGIKTAANSARPVALKAMKLELGKFSTLKDDFPPEYTQELEKCKYYYRRIRGPYNKFCTNNSSKIILDIEGPIITPNCYDASISGTQYYSVGGTNYTPTAIDSITNNGSEGVQISLSSASVPTSNSAGVYVMESGSYIEYYAGPTF